MKVYGVSFKMMKERKKMKKEGINGVSGGFGEDEWV